VDIGAGVKVAPLDEATIRAIAELNIGVKDLEKFTSKEGASGALRAEARMGEVEKKTVKAAGEKRRGEEAKEKPAQQEKFEAESKPEAKPTEEKREPTQGGPSELAKPELAAEAVGIVEQITRECNLQPATVTEILKFIASAEFIKRKDLLDKFNLSDKGQLRPLLKVLRERGLVQVATGVGLRPTQSLRQLNANIQPSKPTSGTNMPAETPSPASTPS
jgi:hypothetical protein